MSESRDLALACLRFSGIHGGDRTSGVVHEFLVSAQSGKTLRVTDANRRYRWLFVDDATKAIVLAVDSSPPLRGIYNVAGAESFTLLELAEAVRRVTGSKSEIVIERPGPGRNSIMNISKFRSATGYVPETLVYHLERMIAPNTSNSGLYR